MRLATKIVIIIVIITAVATAIVGLWAYRSSRSSAATLSASNQQDVVTINPQGVIVYSFGNIAADSADLVLARDLGFANVVSSFPVGVSNGSATGSTPSNLISGGYVTYGGSAIYAMLETPGADGLIITVGWA
jgi:sensor domain CHASE-containing protein